MARRLLLARALGPLKETLSSVLLAGPSSVINAILQRENFAITAVLAVTLLKPGSACVSSDSTV